MSIADSIEIDEFNNQPRDELGGLSLRVINESNQTLQG
jgi:RNase P/RNase MRP subunit p29